MDGKELRPRLWWIAAAWGVALACVVAGVTLFATGLPDTVEDLVPSKTFAPGETVTVALDPADRPAVYIATEGRATFECEISGGPGQARLVNSPASQTIRLGSRTWEQILLVNAPAAGDYQLTCAVQEQGDIQFGVGKDLLAAAGGVLGGVAALVLIPGAGVLVAIIVTVVVLVRRRSHRKRLAAVG
ncbi:hypothetical protein [Nonomuraea sp. NPDC048826]|uniref:hypothetical protein n=1 Tax=Nonomuraea sp. NPDC048826 TaxID=3364347 RepID=UPI00371F7E8F